MKRFNTIGVEETLAAKGAAGRILSGYLGTGPMGGHQCMKLEGAWTHAFDCKHAIAVNSATSGLFAACMAVGVSPGDEVIVSPYTMSATAAVPKILGATIVWADIEPESYTIDPVEVSNRITSKTKAVIATNLFGHPAHLRELRDICEAQGVYLIEDNAQAVYAKEYEAYAGTIGHIGVFSLNVHKQLQVGEGGICTTNNSELNVKLRAAMNHGEMRNSILGLNLRMTEVTAAMAVEQLKKAPQIMPRRIEIGEKVSYEAKRLGLPLVVPQVRPGCIHSYYAWGAQLYKEPSKELPKPFKRGYVEPLYKLPAFRAPCIFPTHLNEVEVVERDMILLELCAIDPTDEEITSMMEDLGRVI